MVQCAGAATRWRRRGSHFPICGERFAAFALLLAYQCDSAAAPYRSAPRSRGSTPSSAMAASPTWFWWLSGLYSGLQAFPPAAGTHEGLLEECRIGARLDNELRKPPGHRDEELVHTLRAKYRRRQLENAQVGLWGPAVVARRRRLGVGGRCTASAAGQAAQLACSYT